MKPFRHPQIVFDHIWKPLVYIPPSDRAFLVHPGTTILPQELPVGWHWHWPLLTAIRQVTSEKIEFHFNNQQLDSFNNDEPITAVSRDHHLFTSQGLILISADMDASTKTLSQLNRHTVKRIIRPMIRQVIRQAIAQFDADSMSEKQVADALLHIALPLFVQHGLLVHNIELASLEHYRPQVM